MANPVLTGFLLDACIATMLFVHWFVVGAIVDQTGNHEEARKYASLWLCIATIGTNAFTLGRSYLFFQGQQDPAKRPETTVGLFCEIVSLAQGWGTAFCFVRVWSLEPDHPFQKRPFLHNIGNSVFELSLVQAGVGWAAEAPVTVGERVVAWCAAYIGGVLCLNLFLVSVVLAHRGWWVNAGASAPAYQYTGVPLLANVDHLQARAPSSRGAGGDCARFW